MESAGGGRTKMTVKLVTAAGIGTSLLMLSGLLLTATVIAVVAATPLLVIFSPVLVPAGVVVLLAVTGLVASGGFGAAAVSAMAWIYNYAAGKRPMGSETVDKLRAMIVERVRMAKEYGLSVQSKAQQVVSS